MRFFPTCLIVFLVFGAMTLTLGHIGAEAPQARQPGENPTDAELRMSILATAPESSASLGFQITFENVSDQDTVLNLGMMLGNGKVHLPDAVRLFLTDPDGQSRKVHFSDKRFPGVAGRVDDYAVPLRAGSAYTVKLSLKDFWSPETNEFALELKPGRYGVRAEFIGNGAQHVNSDTNGLRLMHFWTGKLTSDVAQFQIGKQG